MLNDWISEVSKHKQILFCFLSGTLHFFFFVLLVGCVFVSVFANFSRLYWPNARPVSSFPVDSVHNGGKISRIFIESDEYLCPLTVSSKARIASLQQPSYHAIRNRISDFAKATYFSTKNPINKLAMNNRRLLIAAEFPFVHSVENDS